jgi:hypothetical protein
VTDVLAAQMKQYQRGNVGEEILGLPNFAQARLPCSSPSSLRFYFGKQVNGLLPLKQQSSNNIEIRTISVSGLKIIKCKGK